MSLREHALPDTVTIVPHIEDFWLLCLQIVIDQDGAPVPQPQVRPLETVATRTCLAWTTFSFSPRIRSITRKLSMHLSYFLKRTALRIRAYSLKSAGKTVNKTVSSKSSGSTASAKTRANASTTDATAESDDSQAKSNLESPEPPRRNNSETKRVPAHPIAALAAKTDGALIFGDLWIGATAFATSGLLSPSEIPSITATALSVWCMTSLVRGDYSTAPDSEAAWIHGWSTYTGILYACHTWLFATPVLLLAYAVLVSHGLLPADPVMHVVEGSRVSPALELQVALLILMTAWRGIYYAFKDGIL